MFVFNITNEKFDTFISEALKDTRAYDFDFNHFNHFLLIFHFLTVKERDLHCSDEIILRTKIIHTSTYHKIIQHHYITNTPARNPEHRFTFINLTKTSPYFLNFTYCFKNTNRHGILQNHDPIRQMYKFCSLITSFDVKESRPLIFPREYIQPIEVHILECIHKTKNNHKLNNLIQNT